MKPLSDQISRGQSFVHGQKTARDQFVQATDRRPFGDFNKTFPRPLRPLCDCVFLVAKRSHRSRKLCLSVILF